MRFINEKGRRREPSDSDWNATLTFRLMPIEYSESHHFRIQMTGIATKWIKPIWNRLTFYRIRADTDQCDSIVNSYRIQLRIINKEGRRQLIRKRIQTNSGGIKTLLIIVTSRDFSLNNKEKMSKVESWNLKITFS